MKRDEKVGKEEREGAWIKRLENALQAAVRANLKISVKDLQWDRFAWVCFFNTVLGAREKVLNRGELDLTGLVAFQSNYDDIGFIELENNLNSINPWMFS